MAIQRDTERRIIELRAQGKSYATIASETGVAKQTAIDACRRNKEEVATLQALAIDELHETQKVTYRERITALSSLMQKIKGEIDKRDLSKVSTGKLIDLYIKQASALKDELVEPSFKSTEEQERDRQEREYLERLTATPEG